MIPIGHGEEERAVAKIRERLAELIEQERKKHTKARHCLRPLVHQD